LLLRLQLNFHGSSLESLHKHFSIDMLPEEIGGTMPAGDKLALVSASLLDAELFSACVWITPFLVAEPFFFRNTLRSFASSADRRQVHLECRLPSLRILNMSLNIRLRVLLLLSLPVQ
jgi:hypothetical protein